MGHERNHGVSPVQQQARALADPTRYRIFRYVVDASEPPRVASISRHFGLSESAVRQHLAKLCEAGLVSEEQAARKGPGRPPLQYRAATAGGDGWGTPSPYQDVLRLVLELLRTGQSGRQVGVAAGRMMAVAAGGPRGTLERLEAELARRGFEPERLADGQAVDLVLRRCPYEAAALVGPDVICDLHRGLAEGIVAGAGSEVEVTGLDLRDPRQAGCRLRLRLVGDQSGATSLSS